MIINILYAVDSKDGLEHGISEIFYNSSETLPLDVYEGSIAYCYDGADKGKVKIFNGSVWVEQ